MCDPGFGENVDVNAVLEELIEKAPRLKSTDAQMVLRDQYETTYGIYNHAVPENDHPFALIMMNDSEDTVTHGALHDRMTQYLDCDIHKYFGLSFLEFIEQPTYVIVMQLELAQERIRKEAPITNALKKQLDGLSS